MNALMDLVGHRYGMLEVLRLASRSPRVTWLCRCDCGREVFVKANNLRSGNSTSCGCTHAEASKKKWRDNRDRMKPLRPLIDISGKKFGRLTAIELVQASSADRPVTMWRFRCDCGEEVTSESYNVRKGHTSSCGCYQRELAREQSTTHGHAVPGQHSSEYRSWIAMKARCYNSKHDAYPWYGERGITVCPEWKDDFARFLADMGPKPTPQHTIDREDPDKNYEPGNCRWATRKEQATENRRQRAA